MHNTDPGKSSDENLRTSSTINSNNAIPNKAQVSRRSFLIKGAITAPILASFVNKPLWAADDNCINSGSMSGNLSNHSCAAVARSASWWADASNSLWNGIEFNGVSLAPSSKFNQVILTAPLKLSNNNKYHKKTNGVFVFRSLDTDTNKRSLRYVLRNGPQIDRELVAALLNIGHPGIAYDGYDDPLLLISDYQLVKDNYLMSLNSGASQASLNALFDTFAESLANINRDYDNLPGVP